MAWWHRNLKDIMPKAFSAAKKVQVEASEEYGRLTEALDAVQDALDAANEALALTESDIQKLKATGFAVIALSPKKGSWATRLVDAPNAPSTNTGYSCGYFNIATALTEYDAMLIFNDMKKALTEKPEIEPIEPALPEPFTKAADIKSDFEPDVWRGLTFGEMMPGTFNALQTLWNTQKAAVANIQNMKDQLDKKISLLGQALARANALISGLETSGLYQFVMEPGPGSWISRAVSETDAPPTTEEQYSFGFAAVAVAADMAGCQTLYERLQGVM